MPPMKSSTTSSFVLEAVATSEIETTWGLERKDYMPPMKSSTTSSFVLEAVATSEISLVIQEVQGLI